MIFIEGIFLFIGIVVANKFSAEKCLDLEKIHRNAILPALKMRWSTFCGIFLIQLALAFLFVYFAFSIPGNLSKIRLVGSISLTGDLLLARLAVCLTVGYFSARLPQELAIRSRAKSSAEIEKRAKQNAGTSSHIRKFRVAQLDFQHSLLKAIDEVRKADRENFHRGIGFWKLADENTTDSPEERDKRIQLLWRNEKILIEQNPLILRKADKYPQIAFLHLWNFFGRKALRRRLCDPNQSIRSHPSKRHRLLEQSLLGLKRDSPPQKPPRRK